MRRALLLVVLAVAGIAGAWKVFSGPGLPGVGATYANEAELFTAMTPKGYLKMGQFGGGWPAEVTEVTAQNDAIKFTLAGQSPNVYDAPAYAGYRFVLVRMVTKNGGKEFGYLFKSKDKVE